MRTCNRKVIRSTPIRRTWIFFFRVCLGHWLTEKVHLSCLYFALPASSWEYGTTRENIQLYYTPRHLIRDLLSNLSFLTSSKENYKKQLKQDERADDEKPVFYYQARFPPLPRVISRTVQLTNYRNCVIFLLVSRVSRTLLSGVG